MPAARKTTDSPKLNGAWIQRRRSALIKSGIKPLLLQIAIDHDAAGLTFRQISAKNKKSASWARPLYLKLRRQLLKPSRKNLVPARIRLDDPRRLLPPAVRLRLNFH